MADEITIILADDHPLFRSGVKYELENTDGLKVIGEASDGEEARKLILTMKPRIAILDIQMPKLSGLDIARCTDLLNSSTSIILLTMFKDKQTFFEAIDLGVNGYVLKDDAVNDIVNAVCSVASGKNYISPALSDLMLQKIKPSSNKISNPYFECLTPTERNILKLVSELKTNDEIAEQLSISKRTVENHKVKITSKLELGESRHLLKFAIQNKFNL